MTFVAGVFRVLLALIMIVGVVVAGVVIFVLVSHAFQSTAPTDTSRTVMFEVQPGESVQQIADNLQSAGVIDSTFWFRLQLKLKGAESSIKAGKFQLTRGMDTDRLISSLTTSPEDAGIRFTVVEGKRLEEVAETLDAQGIISASTFLSLTTTPAGAARFQDDFLAKSGKPGDRGLEGYLFPDTYEIKQGGGDNSELIIHTMLKNMEEKFTPEMMDAIAARKLNVHQVLTVASIVQREGVVPDELPTIASVYWNRLSRGMELDADPTTQYALGKTGQWWPKLELSPRTVDNPYNTYVIPALPPGPICLPGLAAITATVYPNDTKYLYFVAKNDGSGSHAFAETYEQQQQNQAIYEHK